MLKRLKRLFTSCPDHHLGSPHVREEDKRLVMSCYSCGEEHEVKVELKATHVLPVQPEPLTVEQESPALEADPVKPSALELRSKAVIAHLETRAQCFETMGDPTVAQALRENAPAIARRMFRDIT
jgi:hypothetical protein